MLNVTKFVLLLAITFFLLTPESQAVGEERTWVDKSGKRKIVAELIDFDGNAARLKRTSGKIVKVTLAQLSDADVQFLKDYEAKKKAAEDESAGSGSGETDPPKTETPKTDPPKMDPPKTETPKTETPKTETPKTETPKTETPKTETPKTEAPKTEAPKTEAPKTEAPKTETPKTETPKTEAPKNDAPKNDAPKNDGPKTDPTKTNEAETRPGQSASETADMKNGNRDEENQGSPDSVNANANAPGNTAAADSKSASEEAESGSTLPAESTLTNSGENTSTNSPEPVSLAEAKLNMEAEPVVFADDWMQQVPALLQGPCRVLHSEKENFVRVRDSLDLLNENWPSVPNPVLVDLVRNVTGLNEKFSRLKAVNILIERDPAGSFGYIFSLARDPSMEVRWKVLDFLGATKNPSVLPGLAGLLNGPDPSKVATQLEKFGVASEPFAVDYLTANNTNVRLEICQLLGKVGSPSSIDALEKVKANDSNSIVKLQARSAISKIKKRNRQ